MPSKHRAGDAPGRLWPSSVSIRSPH